MNIISNNTIWKQHCSKCIVVKMYHATININFSHLHLLLTANNKCATAEAPQMFVLSDTHH